MVENSVTDLVWLAPDNTVVVPRGQLDQPALHRYAPRTPGKGRAVRVELRIPTQPLGRHAGDPAVEVWLDGRQVGELTTPMSRRYGPVIHETVRNGERAGAEARVVHGRRGIEMEISLPDLPTGAHAAPPVVAPPTPRAVPPVRRRTGRPLLVGAGVVTGLLVISGVAGGRYGAAPTVPAATPAAAAAATTAPPTPAAPAPTRPVAPIPAPKPPFAVPTAPAVRTVPVTGADVTVYDHTGDRDNEHRVERVIDGDPRSSWRTFHYFEPFPALKPGVGIMLSFASAVRPAQLTITSPSPGTVVEIRSAPTADADFADTALITEATLVDGTTTVPITEPRSLTHLLVWITKLGGDDGKNVTEINEIEVMRTV